MAYCTHADVANFLQRPAFSGSTTPLADTVTDEIATWEAFIDSETGHAFDARTITDEYHSFPTTMRKFGLFEVHINLNHRQISGITALNVWDGSTWENFVSTRTEGRSADWWYDATDGIIFFRGIKPFINEFAVKVTYTYGDSAVPADIKGACIRLAAISVVANYHQQMELGTGALIPMDNSTKVDTWRKQADDILKRHTEAMFVPM
ncbi:MAG: hypothetical protein CMB80_07840 [Flammeovirgaceae bacterium]|nr:hypothetical protein [Flammeovirgaceae bacterium]|tara:strand:- start:6757 stop:7377 length:621 start_codon:yes stop_codon:yes gene_type:complete